MAMLTKAEEDRDVAVTWEDQERINTFSRLTTRLGDYQAKLIALQKQKQNTEDASSELMMLVDDSEMVPFRVGEAYIEVTQDEAQEMLEERQQEIDTEVAEIEEKVEGIKATLATLKVELYAKFGKTINLESD
eukprot:comp27235_c0_seq1/m.47146 comp27235_c0_seq1/g.47146  ORF comp27235_c0_seq1/g.47146 comp27235_c0_seq1/m.47146 type:complete len:133 (-) comp27235_c0_seq1:476-874(-)